MLRFYLFLFLFLRDDAALLFANHGDNVTLLCHYDHQAKYLSWYKQIAGEQPQIISSFYKHSPHSNTFYNQFKDNRRFSIHTGEGFYHLNISDLNNSDSAMYYCGRTSIAVTEFGKGTFLVLKDPSCKSLLQQPEVESAPPGSSVTLTCTVTNGSIDRQHIYWFKKNYGNSNMGILYIHSHSSSECVRSPADGCVYSLSTGNVKESDAGLYYCAVASCGEMLFGKGTRLDVNGNGTLQVLAYCATGILVVSVILNIILFGILYKNSRKKQLHSEESQDESCTPDKTPDAQNDDCLDLQYATLEFKKRRSTSRRQKNSGEESIYSGVRLTDLQ